MCTLEQNELIEYKNSRIHCTGVFAKKAIPKGTRIIQYKGELITKKEADKRQTHRTQNGHVYIFALNGKYDIDGAVNGNGAHLINHSCDPNCEAVSYHDKEIWIEAVRDILAGEELGYDYGFDEEDFKDHPCQCGAANCRGYIIDSDVAKKLGIGPVKASKAPN